jgi:hypothetical protein
MHVMSHREPLNDVMMFGYHFHYSPGTCGLDVSEVSVVVGNWLPVTLV